MNEYNLELDDIRWYLSRIRSREILSYLEKPDQLALEIWSGRLGDRLYHMEEQFLQELGNDLAEYRKDETQVRTIMSEARAARRRRPRL